MAKNIKEVAKEYFHISQISEICAEIFERGFIQGFNYHLEGDIESMFKNDPDSILLTVCRYYGIEVLKMKSNIRSRNLTRAKAAYCYLSVKTFKNSTVETAKCLGNKHHTVVLHHIRENANNITFKGIEEEIKEIASIFKEKQNENLL